MRDWQKNEEIGSAWVIKLTGVLLRFLPHAILVLLAYPVSFFYYLAAPKARRSLRTYIENFHAHTGRRLHVYPFFLSFSITLVEKGESWAGRVSTSKLQYSGDTEAFLKRVRNREGMVMLMSHLGSAEEFRALKAQLEKETVGGEIPGLSVVDFEVSDKFVSMLKSLNPKVTDDLLSIRTMDVSSIERMSDVAGKGGLVAIAGDRSASRNFLESFFGKDAAFPYGSFYIPALLGIPVYFMHCVRKNTFGFRKSYVLDIKEPESRVKGDSRKARQEYAKELCREYARNLEELCLRYPYQWYNFFDFWSLG